MGKMIISKRPNMGSHSFKGNIWKLRLSMTYHVILFHHSSKYKRRPAHRIFEAVGSSDLWMWESATLF
ncbi:uncharacterized protein OCT59_010500 [Rhizophagus irregularis]|uniref:Uncharacterized protein n=1 Tax=Rhizophagus irregularis TaxID=588596 RepID=A0A915ZYU4_9GLOM|nr:hypothetical protein OCT59_010500 [Rhizophagus irregularis]GET61415.1 hypothetical protein RIR_jg23659.t1 [Rhizophagus irregularis DAOM 181602=DAOM 197198]CAB4491968.1 unnamed protein product [Rhizophagus irregularis]CAB5392354.1 unnamed protein product [Rhizophagus irregularis]